MRLASMPTACTSPVRESIATTEGSESTIPRPRTYTSVLAVPRSTAMSRPPNPVRYEKKPTGRGQRSGLESTDSRSRAGPGVYRSALWPNSLQSRCRKEFRAQLQQPREGQSDDIEVVPFDPRHERRALPLDRVAARPVAPLAGAHVPLDQVIVELPEAHGGDLDGLGHDLAVAREGD